MIHFGKTNHEKFIILSCNHEWKLMTHSSENENKTVLQCVNMID